MPTFEASGKAIVVEFGGQMFLFLKGFQRFWGHLQAFSMVFPIFAISLKRVVPRNVIPT